MVLRQASDSTHCEKPMTNSFGFCALLQAEKKQEATTRVMIKVKWRQLQCCTGQSNHFEEMLYAR
jgi:hypothetical protein